MTNPHQTQPTNIDIRETSERVIEASRGGDHVAAARLLESRRTRERPVLQETLDRYVFTGARSDLDASKHCSMLQEDPELSGPLKRLRQAGLPPRMPVYDALPGSPIELEGLTSAQKQLRLRQRITYSPTPQSLRYRSSTTPSTMQQRSHRRPVSQRPMQVARWLRLWPVTATRWIACRVRSCSPRKPGR